MRQCFSNASPNSIRKSASANCFSSSILSLWMTWWLMSRCLPGGARRGSQLVGCTIPAMRCVSRQYMIPLWGISETSLKRCTLRPTASCGESSVLNRASTGCSCIFSTSCCVICWLWSSALVARGPISLTTRGASNTSSSPFVLLRARTPVTCPPACRICNTS